jgi:hypothetical protein
MFDVSLDTAILLAHVLAGVLLVGSSIFSTFIRRAIVTAPSVESLLLWLDFGRRATAANPLIALVLLASGLYLGSTGWWSQGWFYVAAGSWVVNAALAGLVLKPSAMALAQAAARVGHGPIRPDLDARRRSRAWELAAQTMRATDLGMLYVMYMKPSVLESLLVIGAVFAANLGWQALRERQHQHAAPPAMAASS